MSCIKHFKELDWKRSEVGLSPEQEEVWGKLKTGLEAVADDCPPSSKRQSIRVPAALAVTFEDPERFRHAYLRNISEGGVYVECEHALKLGDRFVLSIVLETPAAKIEQNVQVVWVNANPSHESGLLPGVGVAFLNLASVTKMKIKAIVHDRLDQLIQK